MKRVAGDLGSPQSLGQFMVEENVAQFAVAVNFKDMDGGGSKSQSFVGVQAVKINVSEVVCHG